MNSHFLFLNFTFLVICFYGIGPKRPSTMDKEFYRMALCHGSCEMPGTRGLLPCPAGSETPRFSAAAHVQRWPVLGGQTLVACDPCGGSRPCPWHFLASPVFQAQFSVFFPRRHSGYFRQRLNVSGEFSLCRFQEVPANRDCSRQGSEHAQGTHTGSGQPAPSVPEQDLTPLWQPPAPLVRKNKPGWKTGQVRRLPASHAHGAGLGVNEPSAVTTRRGPAGARPRLTSVIWQKPDCRGSGQKCKQVQLSPCLGSLCCPWPAVGCHTSWTGLVGMAELQDPFQILLSFFYPPPLATGPTLGTCGPPSISAFSRVGAICSLILSSSNP